MHNTTGKGTGGESRWGTPFFDEFDSRLNHEGRGILSMANSGTNTNKSQFFITLKKAAHLDGKHVVFGELVSDEGNGEFTTFGSYHSATVRAT